MGNGGVKLALAPGLFLFAYRAIVFSNIIGGGCDGHVSLPLLISETRGQTGGSKSRA